MHERKSVSREKERKKYPEVERERERDAENNLVLGCPRKATRKYDPSRNKAPAFVQVQGKDAC